MFATTQPKNQSNIKNCCSRFFIDKKDHKKEQSRNLILMFETLIEGEVKKVFLARKKQLLFHNELEFDRLLPSPQRISFGDHFGSQSISNY